MIPYPSHQSLQRLNHNCASDIPFGWKHENISENSSLHGLVNFKRQERRNILVWQRNLSVILKTHIKTGSGVVLYKESYNSSTHPRRGKNKERQTISGHGQFKCEGVEAAMEEVQWQSQDPHYVTQFNLLVFQFFYYVTWLKIFVQCFFNSATVSFWLSADYF